MCKENLHQAGMSVKLTMECKDCAESVDGAPAQACCPQCLEEGRAALLESGHGVRYDTGKRRFYSDEATALADHLELSGALSLLKQRDAMCAKLAEALRVALEAMQDGTVYDSDMEAIEAALKEWEGRK